MERLLPRTKPAPGCGFRGVALDSGTPMPPLRRADWAYRLGLSSGWGFGIARPDPERLVAARFDFIDAVDDIRTDAARALQSRIAATRSLHELWHLRAEAFSLISRRHSQREAADRLATLDRHFA